MSSRFLIMPVLVTLTAATAAAGQLTLNLDPGQSSVEFELGATMHTVHGSFVVERGAVHYDPATGETDGEIVIDATSGDSDNKKRDRDMHGKVLESEKYGEFVLRPTRIEGELPNAGAGSMTVFGTMSIHGSAHEVEIPLEVTVNGESVAIEAEFEVPYVEWGLKDPSKFLLKVAKHVTVTVKANGALVEQAESVTAEESEEAAATD